MYRVNKLSYKTPSLGMAGINQVNYLIIALWPEFFAILAIFDKNLVFLAFFAIVAIFW